jgi:hypothetical protein
MMNPSFLQLRPQGGNLVLSLPELDLPDSRTLEDFGLSEDEWRRAVTGLPVPRQKARRGLLQGSVPARR